MTTQIHNRDREIVARYTDQPTRLPVELREEIETSWGNQPVQLYALADLDASMRITEQWVALGPDRIAVARRKDRGGWDVYSFDRARIREVRDAPGLSGSVLSFLATPDEPALAVLRYTHRQRRAMENIKFVLREQIEGRTVESDDADAEYAESVAGPIKEAQALVSGHRMTVIWRLLGYLKPYRRRVYVGMGAAAMITLVSLVPPYLAGYLIDRVVRPVQDGTLTVGAGAAVAWIAVSAMALVYLVRQGSAMVRLRMMSVLGEFVARDLRRELYEHLQTLSLSFFARKKT